MIGETLADRYEITKHIKDRQSTTIYKAFDLQQERDVAVKILLPDVKEVTRKRFILELLLSAKLNHPNILHMYDSGYYDNRPYLVMEYIDGETLSQHIPLTLDKATSYGQQIASALDYMHTQSIIHRQISSNHIMITSDNAIKIIGLHLLLHVPEQERVSDNITNKGMVVGVLPYLSPEQAQGHKLDFRTDIYSLGILLYEMAIGKRPFLKQDDSALLLQHVNDIPPKPRDSNPNIPQDLENIILKALEKMTYNRYQSGQEMARALLISNHFIMQGSPS